MAVIKFEIQDSNERGGDSVRVTVTPPIHELVVKAHQDHITSAEALAMHLARKALEYSQAQEEKASRIVIPKIVTEI